ncbi:MAG TPA: hypothetical protein DCK98_12730 [Chloroflexi bacterium]|nr:hypothetical protein [Chloroflexota bacterium]HAL25897.1 hypothetical protein [Chloroflexota bacterium]
MLFFRPVLFRAVVFFLRAPVVFRAVVFFRPVVLRAVVFLRPVVLRPVLFRAVVFLRPLLEVVFLRPAAPPLRVVFLGPPPLMPLDAGIGAGGGGVPGSGDGQLDAGSC